MLVLTRRITEQHRDTDVMITCPNGDVVKVSLIQIKGKQVRIGFNFPEGYHIDRAEIFAENTAKRKLDNPNQRVLPL